LSRQTILRYTREPIRFYIYDSRFEPLNFETEQSKNGELDKNFAGNSDGCGALGGSRRGCLLREDRTLIVAVADNIWQKQLEQIRPQLLFRLNSILGHSLVKLIELRIDPKALPKTRMPDDKSGKHPDYAVPFDLLAAASAIQDAALRRAFIGAATSCIKRLENNPQS